MKKVIISILFIFFGITNVYAKDTVFSINKYDDEKFIFINSSYNKENKKDGLITIGTYLKEKVKKDDISYDNYQVMLVKYKRNGKTAWTYRYGKTSSENVNYLTYSYDNEGKIDGYIMVLDNSYDIEQEGSIPKRIFVKIDLDGKYVFEKETGLNESINKIISTYKVDDVVDGYIGITDSSIVRYDKELNLISKKDYHDSSYESIKYTDIEYINSNNGITGYVLIREKKKDINHRDVDVVKYDISLTGETVIKENSNDYVSYKLSQANEGFILYGITDEVKVKKGSTSYYLINYDNNNEELWESVGNVGLYEDNDVYLYPIKKDQINSYFILYKNKDSSYEVTKLDIEGTFKKKVKKIKNEYYNFNSFYMENNENEIYFVGQIKCPEDDNCDYDANSLLLISNEDKVIEVEDSTSQNIIIFVFVFIIGLGFLVYYTRKKKLNEEAKRK